MPRVMRWIMVGWCVFCLGGMAVALWQGAQAYRSAMDNDGQEMAQLAMVFSVARWLGLWVVVAVPAWWVGTAARRKSNDPIP